MKPADGPKVVVLHSGGLDSTVCLLLALEEGLQPISVGIDYGQTHRIELEFAHRQCERLGVDRRVLSIKWDKPHRSIPLDRSVNEIRSSVSTAFLPARNILFLSLAYAEAAGLDAKQVWIGVNSVDFSGYPDCTPEFIDAYRRMVEIGLGGGPKLVAPLQNLSKKEIVALAVKLGLQRQDTWSCYRPVQHDAVSEPCGRCDACVLHDSAWDAVQPA